MRIQKNFEDKIRSLAIVHSCLLLWFSFMISYLFHFIFRNLKLHIAYKNSGCVFSSLLSFLRIKVNETEGCSVEFLLYQYVILSFLQCIYSKKRLALYQFILSCQITHAHNSDILPTLYPVFRQSAVCSRVLKILGTFIKKFKSWQHVPNKIENVRVVNFRDGRNG